ncbi:hypothetical protein PR003_g9938 [Phytophthora rubi]|uniref:RxLR effector protein n=1 Tax=Phytophthora rubi TaxID=129364 RepID=A0A6A3MUD2_9STRA|nr:hypothetical protein PR002_g9711 [Phytophthora rubi]KAE9035282.1 hypothetical protein PR001_g9365 [Phytophthora rubi]KAE9341536.1 hypothetical protein PR003_g9938 [Phytophthora rubi]
MNPIKSAVAAVCILAVGLVSANVPTSVGYRRLLASGEKPYNTLRRSFKSPVTTQPPAMYETPFDSVHSGDVASS